MPDANHRSAVAALDMDVVRLGYDAIGSRYTERSAANEVRLRFVGEMLHRVPADSWVLDLGCGGGEPATRLLSQRCNVMGVDLSDVQIGLARRAAPAARFVIADIARFALRPASVQGVASFYAWGTCQRPSMHRFFVRSPLGCNPAVCS